jgi:hypothetical protein
MKMSFLFLIILFASASHAQANAKLHKNIAHSIDSLLSDTVNEGDMSASVAMNRGKPEMTCQLAPYRDPGKGIAKCEVTFDIESNYSDETQHCQQMCFLIHVYDLKTLSIVSSVESLEQSCIENLSSACD